MTNYFYLTLDTTAPANPSITILGGATFATDQLVDVTIGTTDPDTSGYQMLIWGDVDPTYSNNIKQTEEDSVWIAYNNSQQVKLSPGDGNKTLFVKIRDDVHNTSARASDSITLDMSKPTVEMTRPDVDRISKQPGKDTASFTFTSDKPFVEYKVKVVTSPSSLDTAGDLIPDTHGSQNTSGTGTFAAGTPISVTIKGADLETVTRHNGTGLEPDIIKVFVKDESGKWSV